MSTVDNIRAACRAIADSACHVHIDTAALGAVLPGPVPVMNPEDHYLEGAPDAVAAYVLTLDAINFGSGWFDALPGLGYLSVARALSARWRAEGPMEPAALRVIGRKQVAQLLGQPADHELIGLYATALRELGMWLGDRSALEVVRACEPSAQALVDALAQGLTMWRDTGFLKRAQIAASDLALAGVAHFEDLDRLTAFADNVLPQVLRHHGVLVLEPMLAARIDRAEYLAAGSAEERELRACAIHACELLAPTTGLTARELDNVLWTRGQDRAYAITPPHRTRTTYY